MTEQQKLSEQQIVRRENLQKIIKLGIDPYPAAACPVTTSAQEIKEKFPEDEAAFQDVSIAGRLMTKRVMGKASFAVLQDSTGRIQLYVARDEICPGENKTLYNELFKKLLDIGDLIGVKGYVFYTKTGEITIHVRELTLLSSRCGRFRW